MLIDIGSFMLFITRKKIVIFYMNNLNRVITLSIFYQKYNRTFIGFEIFSIHKKLSFT